MAVDTNDRVCKGSTSVATSRPDRLAQWIARQTSNLKVAGSSPALVKPFFAFPRSFLNKSLFVVPLLVAPRLIVCVSGSNTVIFVSNFDILTRSKFDMLLDHLTIMLAWHLSGLPHDAVWTFVENNACLKFCRMLAAAIV